MTVHLPQELESTIQAEVLSGQFASEDDLVAAAVRDYLQRKQQQASHAKPAASEEASAPAHKPIWEGSSRRRPPSPTRNGTSCPPTC